MQKFLGQGSNLLHSSNPSYCSDNVGYLTHCTTQELHKVLSTQRKDTAFTIESVIEEAFDKVFENIKKFADVWDDIDKKSKNLLLKIIIDFLELINLNIEFNE